MSEKAQTTMENATNSPVISMKNVNKLFGDFQVLNDINLNVTHGERIVICGPSGSGKSTLIRCINRLEEHQQGDIIVDGIELTNDVRNISAIRRETGMVFQSLLSCIFSNSSKPSIQGIIRSVMTKSTACFFNIFSAITPFSASITS